jgi:hypothetical protein
MARRELEKLEPDCASSTGAALCGPGGAVAFGAVAVAWVVAGGAGAPRRP